MNCNVIRDILPLYADGACSNESKQLVEEHIDSCEECRNQLLMIKDDECVTSLAKQGDDVVLRHAKKEMRKSMTMAAVISGILMIPVLVCMIVNLATGHGLSWFFIVLTSLLVVASITVVPLAVTTNKGLWTLGSFTLSLLILFATVCIYTRTSWFFIASTATLFGLSLCFMPFVSKAIKRGFWSNKRALFTCIVDTALLLVMLGTIGICVGNAFYWKLTGAILLVLLSYIAIMCVVLSMKKNKKFKFGLAAMISGIVFASADNIVLMILGYNTIWHVFRPFTWKLYTIESNINWIMLIVFEIVGFILFIVGIKKGNVEKNEE
ncbi:MAG: zf-HC2 domain-containing protein [Lachnospiraceae bacterium]|nr:zf-HC2 domain-containing protein [Candidatus Colinaster equi]